MNLKVNTNRIQGFIYPVINNAPVCGDTIQSELNSLVDAINKAIGAY